MDKKRLSKILARATREDVLALVTEIPKMYRPVLVKEPQKTLCMIKLREPVKESLFYLGEVIVCEAVVELDGAQGCAVCIGDDAEKTLAMAVIDAAIGKGLFTGMEKLLALEAQQQEHIMRENALHLKTMVNFESMDGEAPKDVTAHKEARV